MADGHHSDDPIRRVIDANVAYYRALGTLSKEYWRAAFGVWRGLLGELTPSVRPSASAAAPIARAPGSPAQPRDPTLVLEAESGQEAQGVFLVENRLSRAVSTPVVTSSFTSRSGQTIRPTLRIVPGTVTLEPGARTLVQIIAVVTDELEQDVSYEGEVYVPDLSDRGVPVLVRRRASTTVEPPSIPSPKRKRRQTRRRAPGS